MKKSTWIVLVLSSIFFSTAGLAGVNGDLIEAIDAGDFKGVSEAISNGADVNAFSRYGESALNKAIFEEEIEIVDILIKNGADVNMKNRDSDLTPLMWAAIQCYPDGVELLVKSGAAVNARTKDGSTALTFAEKSGCVYQDQMVQMLKEAGAR